MNAPDTHPTAQEADAVNGSGDNRHYLRALTDMADRGKVLTHAAIYTDKGIKLVDKGTRVDSALYERLVKYKLRDSIEDQLSVENMVSVQSLVQMARAQCENDTLAYLLVHTLDGMTESKLLAPVRAMPLPPAIAVKLTVMREQHPRLFTHSVSMMLVAVYLGIKSGLGERECMPLAAAALLHDMGVMHMDPAWHDPANKISGAGRKQLLAHPVTAMLIIREQHVYPRSVEQAVLEHHEFMDGSGYPRRLRGGQISRLGQILMTAEVVTAFFEKYASEEAAQRLSLTLRLNHRKFPAELVACLLPLLQIRAVQGDAQTTQGEVERCIALLSGAFEDWEHHGAVLAPQATQPTPESAGAMVRQWLAALQKSLFESGSHPRQLAEMLPQLQGDAQGLAELVFLGHEALWQLQRIVNMTYSHWTQLPGSQDAGDMAVLQWREACAARLAEEAMVI